MNPIQITPKDKTPTAFLAEINQSLASVELAPEPADTSHTQALLERSRYDEKIPPIRTPAVASIAGLEAIWKKNVHTLVAGAKVGKSRFLAAMIKSLVHGERALGWSENKGGAKVIYLDFEQDHEDFYDSMHDQAGITKDEVYAFNLAGVSTVKAVECVDVVLDLHRDASVLILDGVADLCSNVNDQDEANALVAHLMTQAREYDIAIVGVLHLNPGSDAKSRGHLGSQLERKSKTVIQISVKEGVRHVFIKYGRRGEIYEKDGPRFQWCNDAGNFVELTDTKAQEALKADAGDLREMMSDVLKGRTVKTFAHTELLKALQDHTRKSESTAKTMISKMVDLKILVKANKLYSMG